MSQKTHIALAQPSSLEQWDGFVAETVLRMVAALPMTINDDDLKRARARLKLAFSQQSGGSKLFQCTPDSVASCIAMSTVTGLFPGGHSPDVDLIPRKNRKNGNRLELNWQISYRGYIRLCRRNPGYDITPQIVYDGDEFSVELGLHPTLRHVPNLEREPFNSTDETWKAIRLAYVVIERPQGAAPRFGYLDKGQLKQRRMKAPDQSFWEGWPAEKTLATICRYAGQREMFPVDDPTRYALGLDLAASTQPAALPERLTPQALLPAEGPSPQLPASLPAGVDTLAADVVDEILHDLKARGKTWEAVRLAILPDRKDPMPPNLADVLASDYDAVADFVEALPAASK